MNGASYYKKVQNESNDDFVQEYAPLVKRIAHHLLARLPASVLIDDLIQSGMIGLIEAARNFDETKGAAFSTYAGIRIRGAMLDEIRKVDWAPRSVHKNSRMVTQAIKEIENNTGREARDDEVAAALDISLEEYHKLLQDSTARKIFSFEDIGLSVDMMAAGGSNSIAGPLDGIQKDDIKKKLAAEISRLPEREKLVLALYYDEELNLREVGEVLGVSESRISQIHSQAMLRLNARIGSWNL